MSSPESNGEALESGRRYEGYTDFKSVSQRIAKSVDDALEGYAFAASVTEEGYRGDKEEVVYAKSAIRGAALKLVPELRLNAQGSSDDGAEEFEEMLRRWMEHGVDDNTGYIEAIRHVDFYDINEPIPDWVEDFVLDIRSAAFKLGYLKAGRVEEETNIDPIEEDVNSMFKGLSLQ